MTYCLQNAVHPHVNRSEKMKAATCPLTAEEPVIIHIQPKTSSGGGVASSSSGHTETRAGGHGSRESETVRELRRRTLRKRPYPDTLKVKTKSLVDDLRESFPSIPECVLSTLQLPPRAVHRGYFVLGELKRLHQQALGKHLDKLFHEHVRSCTLDTCPTCINYFERKAALGQAKREPCHGGRGKAGGRRKKPLRGKRRKTCWRYDSEDEEEPFLSSASPSPPPPPLKRSLKQEPDQCDACIRVKWCDRGRLSALPPAPLEGSSSSSSKAHHTVRMKRYSSDTDIHIHLGQKGVKDGGNHSCDDSCLSPRGLAPDAGHTSRGCRSWSGLRRGREAPRKDSHVYVTRSAPWASLYRVMLADRKLRQALERGCLPYSEQQYRGAGRAGKAGKAGKTGKAACSSVVQDVLVLEVLAISVGRQTVSGQEGQLCHAKLYVNFSERKLVYVFDLGSVAVSGGGRNSSSRTPAKDKRHQHGLEAASAVQPEAACPPWVCIDVPFTSLQALNITSDKVVVVVSVLPNTRLMTCQEGCWTHLSGDSLLSPACRAHLATTKARLAVFPAHQLHLQPGKAPALRKSLCEFSPWFKQALSRLLPIPSNYTPSWALPHPTAAAAATTPGKPVGAIYVPEPRCARFPSLPKLVRCDPGTSRASPVINSQGIMHLLPPLTPLYPDPANLPHQKGCSCRETCRGAECPCARVGVLCHPRQSCVCRDCDNPLNILHILKVNVGTAHLDDCLLQNLYGYHLDGLCSLLVSRVVLPCCGASPKLYSIIPGTVKCSHCGMTVSYSWCSHHIHLQTLCPRNHCKVCGSCKPVFYTHCLRCRRCTRSSLQGLCDDCGHNKS